MLDPHANNLLEHFYEYQKQTAKYSAIQAFRTKYHSSNLKEKGKLLLKLNARILGFHKCFFLGGYRKEEDFKQHLQDDLLYHSLLTKTPEQICTDFLINRKNTIVSYSDKSNFDSYAYTEQLRNLLLLDQTYIAFMVESLDTGGLEEVVKLIATKYHEAGIPLKIFCARQGGAIAEELIKQDIEVIVFHNDIKKFKKYINEHMPMLINLHYVSTFMNFLKHSHILLVEVIHNMYLFLDADRLKLEQEKTSYIQKYIAVSQTVKDVFCQKVSPTSKSKIEVIGNAANKLKEITLSRQDIRDPLGISKDSFVFLTVGTIDARKNQLGILRAWDIFQSLLSPNATLLLVGATGDAEYRKKIQSIIKERNLEQSVRIIDYSNEIANLLNAADAVIIDSYYEGWSVAATEALQCGLPLIHSSCGSGPELVNNGQNGILIDNPLDNICSYDKIPLYDAMHAGINDNLEQLICALMTFYIHSSEWAEKRTSIAEYCDEYFSARQMIEQYSKVFLDVYEKTPDTKGEENG